MSKVQYQEIEIDKIVIPKERARATFTPEQEAELRASIEKNGFTVPILVRPIGDGKYELIDGEHRINIVKEMGWKKIPAMVSEMDDAKAQVVNFLANTARGTQDPISISEALNRAYEAGASIEELAAATGHTKEWVRKYMAYSKLPDVYKEAMRKMELPVGVIDEALRLPTPEEVDYLLGQYLIHKWPVGVVKQMVDNRLQELEAVKKRAELLGEEIEPPEPNYEELAQYDECMICKRRVPRGQTWMKVLCNDCLSLLEYIISHLGDPVEAMDYVYKALQRQMEWEKYQELKKKFEPEAGRTESEGGKDHTTPLPHSEEERPPFPISSDEIDKQK